MILVIIIPLLIIGYIFLRSELNYAFLIKNFRKFNVIVFGKKGSGKDAFFQAIINRRKEPYYSNIGYGYKQAKTISVNDLSVLPNTYENALNNQFEKIEPAFDEKVDFYISDGGIYLPSQYDSKIDAKYPSLFIFYVLIRHLFNSNIHINYNGSITRLYKKLREQADGYIRMRGVLRIFGFLVLHGTWYDKFESAEQSLQPLNSRLMNGYSKAEADLYLAQNGEIKPFFVILPIKKIKYNTRYFKDVLLKEHP